MPTTTPADRVRAYLQARATIYDGSQPGTCTTARNTDTGEVHKLLPADLQALLPPENPHSPALEVHDVWYSARTQPDNQLWVETRDPEEFSEQCTGVPDLVLRKHTVYKYGTSEILKELP